MVGSIVCRYVTRTQLGACLDARGIAQWLGRAEQQALAALRCPERRMSWFSGRVLAKRVLMESAAARHVSRQRWEPTDIEIKSANRAGQAVRPQVTVGTESLDCSLSVSHTSRGALVALSFESGASIGVDLVEPIGLDRRFVELWFTDAEQHSFGLPSLLPRASTVWACKEAVYKACNQDAGFAPRQIEIQRSWAGTLTARHFDQPLAPDSVLQNWQVDGQMAAIAIVPGRAASQQESAHHD